MRALILIALSALILWQLYVLVQRLVLAVLVTMILLLSSGCSYYIVPAKPHVRYCWPVNSWKCDPRVEWSQM